jgi:hypothetical protein
MTADRKANLLIWSAVGLFSSQLIVLDYAPMADDRW